MNLVSSAVQRTLDKSHSSTLNSFIHSLYFCLGKKLRNNINRNIRSQLINFPVRGCEKTMKILRCFYFVVPIFEELENDNLSFQFSRGKGLVDYIVWFGCISSHCSIKCQLQGAQFQTMRHGIT